MVPTNCEILQYDLTVTWIVIIVSWIGELSIKTVEFTNFLKSKVTWKHLSLLAQLFGLSYLILISICTVTWITLNYGLKCVHGFKYRIARVKIIILENGRTK